MTVLLQSREEITSARERQTAATKTQSAPESWFRHSLSKGELLSLDLDQASSLHLQIHSGSAWITMENDAEDYVLSSGENISATGPGRLVIEGLSETLLEVEIRFYKKADERIEK